MNPDGLRYTKFCLLDKGMREARMSLEKCAELFSRKKWRVRRAAFSFAREARPGLTGGLSGARFSQYAQ